MLIKICGITQTEDALIAVSEGAHFVGIIQHPDSLRYVKTQKAETISKAVHRAGGIAVAVFVNSSAEEMLTFCEKTEITHIQLHGPLSRQQHHLLPPHFTRIYARSVEQNGSCAIDHDLGQSYLDPKRDYLLFDSVQAGSGVSFDWSRFSMPPNSHDFRFLLAGGLNPDNIQAAIQQLHPDGVDVSSGVEGKICGIKDYRLMKQFISNARFTE